MAHDLDASIGVVAVDSEQELVVGKKLSLVLVANGDSLRHPALNTAESQLSLSLDSHIYVVSGAPRNRRLKGGRRRFAGATHVRIVGLSSSVLETGTELCCKDNARLALGRPRRLLPREPAYDDVADGAELLVQQLLLLLGRLEDVVLLLQDGGPFVHEGCGILLRLEPGVSFPHPTRGSERAASSPAFFAAPIFSGGSRELALATDVAAVCWGNEYSGRVLRGRAREGYGKLLSPAEQARTLDIVGLGVQPVGGSSELDPYPLHGHMGGAGIGGTNCVAA